MSSQTKDTNLGKDKSQQEKSLREQLGHAVVSCDICSKEISKSIAHTKEAEEYFLHFCGVDCYDEWKKHQNQTQKK